MGWKIWAIISTVIWITGVPDLFSEPQQLRHSIGRAFTTVGLVALLAYAFGWPIMNRRLWLPFALAFAGWLTFNVVYSTVASWQLFFRNGNADAAGLLIAIGIPVLVSVLQWLPVWRYAHGRTAAREA